MILPDQGYALIHHDVDAGPGRLPLATNSLCIESKLCCAFNHALRRLCLPRHAEIWPLSPWRLDVDLSKLLEPKLSILCDLRSVCQRLQNNDGVRADPKKTRGLTFSRLFVMSAIVAPVAFACQRKDIHSRRTRVSDAVGRTFSYTMLKRARAIPLPW